MTPEEENTVVPVSPSGGPEGVRGTGQKRHRVLALLGRISTIRNQLAQADSYLAIIKLERKRLDGQEQAQIKNALHLARLLRESQEALVSAEAEYAAVQSPVLPQSTLNGSRGGEK
jgi:hypothetical protein